MSHTPIDMCNMQTQAGSFRLTVEEGLQLGAAVGNHKAGKLSEQPGSALPKVPYSWALDHSFHAGCRCV